VVVTALAAPEVGGAVVGDAVVGVEDVVAVVEVVVVPGQGGRRRRRGGSTTGAATDSDTCPSRACSAGGNPVQAAPSAPTPSAVITSRRRSRADLVDGPRPRASPPSWVARSRRPAPPPGRALPLSPVVSAMVDLLLLRPSVSGRRTGSASQPPLEPPLAATTTRTHRRSGTPINRHPSC
jgi:hypothetical protein